MACRALSLGARISRTSDRCLLLFLNQTTELDSSHEVRVYGDQVYVFGKPFSGATENEIHLITVYPLPQVIRLAMCRNKFKDGKTLLPLAC